MKRSVKNYATLDAYIDNFASGIFNCLLISGPAGVGKTTAISQRLGDRAFKLVGRTSALAAYVQLYLHTINNNKEFMVLDDTDNFLADQDAVDLLKHLTETKPIKQVMWTTRTKELERLNIPYSFATTIRVAIISNDMPRINRHLKAVVDRGFLINCQIPVAEVHRKVSEWWPKDTSGPEAYDEEVYQFIGKHLGLIREISSRTYKHAAAEKRAVGLDWQSGLFEEFGLDEKMMVAANIYRDPELYGSNKGGDEFVRQTGASRGTYYNTMTKYLEEIGETKQTAKVKKKAAAAVAEPPQGPRIFEAEPEPVEATQPTEELAAGDVEVVAEFREKFEAEPGTADEPPQEVGGPMAG